MKRHLVLTLMTSALFTGLTPLFAGDKITTAKTADGRTVFVNDESSPKAGAPGNSAAADAPQDVPRRITYAYYSHQQRRWIKVGRPSPASARGRPPRKSRVTLPRTARPPIQLPSNPAALA
jgi:hypothetical protein